MSGYGPRRRRAKTVDEMIEAQCHKRGITREKYDSILRDQRGACVCGVVLPRYSIDHDHTCCPPTSGCELCVRGLLCPPCNVALGYVQDSPARLRALAAYLEG